MEYPQNGWFLLGKTLLNWMIGCTPILVGNLHNIGVRTKLQAWQVIAWANQNDFQMGGSTVMEVPQKRIGWFL